MAVCQPDVKCDLQQKLITSRLIDTFIRHIGRNIGKYTKASSIQIYTKPIKIHKKIKRKKQSISQ